MGYTPRVKKITLKKDIERGVKRLSEWSYSDIWGATGTSLAFMEELKKHIDITKAYRAVLKHDNKRWYRLFVYTKDGYEIMFKGVSGGYFGEGTRGCFEILENCGFNKKQCKKAFEYERFTVLKRNV